MSSNGEFSNKKEASTHLPDDKRIKLESTSPNTIVQKELDQPPSPRTTNGNSTPSKPHESSFVSTKQEAFIEVENKKLGSAFFPSWDNPHFKNSSQEVLDLSKNGESKQKQNSDNEIMIIEDKNKALHFPHPSPKAGPSNSFPVKRKIRAKRTFSNDGQIPSLRATIGAGPAPPNVQQRYAMSSMNQFNPQTYVNPPPLWDMIINFPPQIANDYQKFHNAMCLWRNHPLDGCELPVVKRPNCELVPASVIHVKLLSRFASNVVQNIPEQALPKLVSIKMSAAEAWMLNFVNATMCNFNLGLQIFMNGDDLVELKSIEKYYWTVKRIHLEHLLMIYSGELPPGSLFETKNLVGAIINLKKQIVEEIKQINFKQADLRYYN